MKWLLSIVLLVFVIVWSGWFLREPPGPVRAAEAPPVRVGRPLHGPIAMCAVGSDHLAVCFEKSRELGLFDLQNGVVVRQATFGGEPSGVAWDERRSRLLVTTGPGAGFLHALDDQSLEVLSSRAIGHGPVSPLLDDAGNRLFVARRFDDAVEVLDASSLETRFTVKVLREPTALAYSPIHGGRVVVSHLLSDRPATADWTGCSLSVFDPATGDIDAHIPLADGSSGARSVAVTADGRYALSPMVIGSHRVPATAIERGWINKQGLAVVDLETRTSLGAVLLDEVTRGAANPWGMVATEADELWISLAGVHELMKIDWAALRQAMHGLSAEERAGLADDLGFARSWRKRVPLPGHLGPRPLALAGGRLVTAGYFTNSLVSVDPVGGQVTTLVEPASFPEDRGELLFHDATICFQQWMSCSSCHPDARVDALNWDLVNDGPGSPRQAKSMLFSYQTPPTTITGCRADAVVSTRAGLRFLRAVCSEEDATAIDQYLSSLRPVASPHLVEGELSPSALRGREVFDQSAHCGRCHSGAYFTNGGQFRVGTEQAGELGIAFDVPTLREVWRTAPYGNDGRSYTLREMFTENHHDSLHGQVDHLSKRQLDDLMEYVLSL